MKTVIRQLVMAVLSFWGLLYIPLAMVTHHTTDASHPFVHPASQFLTLSFHLVWFVPGVWMAHLLGVYSSLYDVDFVVAVKHPIGWILPAIFWFLLWHLLGLAARRIMKRKKSQPAA